MINLKKKLLVTAISAVSVGLAYAQDSDGNNIEEVIVTGARSAFTNALETKRNASSMVDAISVDDLGVFPDTNIAESIQRIPGVQLSRNGRGEGNGYVINGVSDIQTTVNGRHVVSQGARFATLLDYSSDLIGGITVYKTTSADQLEGGLGGLINVDMGRAFDYDERRLAVGIEGSYVDETSESSPSLAVAYSDRFDTSVGEMGLVLAGQYEIFNSAGYKTEIFGFGDRNDLFDLNSNGILGESEDTANLATGGLRMRRETGERVRASTYASFQWAVSEDTEVYADYMYFISHGRSHQDNLQSRNLGDGAVGQATVNTGKFLDSYTLSNVELRAQPFETDNPYTTEVVGAGVIKNWGDLTAKLDFSYQKGDALFYFQGINYRTYAPEVEFNLGGKTPYFAVSGVDVADAANFDAPGYFETGNDTDYEDPAFSLDFDYATGADFITDIHFGARWNNIKQDFKNYFVFFEVPAENLGAARALLEPSPGDLFTDQSFPTTTWVSAGSGTMRVREDLRELAGVSRAEPEYPLDTNAWVMDERTIAGYAMLDFDTTIFSGIGLDGNAGIRVVRTDLDVQDYVLDNGAVILSDEKQGRDYTEVLPSLNMRFLFTDDLYLRLGYSETLVRPNPSSNFNLDLHVDINTGTGSSGGNPDIEPLMSDNLDASLEYYFGESNLVSLGLFKKDLTGFAQTSVSEEVIDGQTYRISRPRNGLDGEISGYVLAYQQFFDFLPEPFNGLGFSASYTNLDSEIIDPELGSSPATNVADDSYSLTAMYDIGKFSARLSYNAVGDKLLSIGATPDLDRYQDSTAYVDLGMSYAYSENLLVTLDATNLTNEYDNRYVNNAAQSVFYSNQHGKTYQLGIRLNF